MKQRIYIDTSVVGGYFEKEFEIWSRKLIDEILLGKSIAVLSDLTIAEIESAPKQVRDLIEILIEKKAELIYLDDYARELASYYLDEKIVGEKSSNDTLHIALATIHKVDVIVSWNFKHIVNLNKIKLYNAVNLKHGYSLIEIRSPRELTEK